MTERIPSLEAIGYDAYFRGQVAALGDDLVPARIAIAHGESYIAWTSRGSCKAVLVGNRATDWREAIDRPQVGDWVAGTYSESADALLIAHLLDRRTCLTRQASGKRAAPQIIAANIDVVGIVSAFAEGGSAADRRLTDEPRIRRFLTAVAQSRAEPVLIINKIDLSAAPGAVADPFEPVFPGVPVVLTSATHGIGLEALAPWLQPGKTLGLIGLSGVGKSTLVNALVGRAAQRTGQVRESDMRGRHTTTHRELISTKSGALLIDTPGMRELGPWEAEILGGFEDVIAIAASCRFDDCRHAAEPGCAVRDALESGALSTERWASYRTQGQRLEDSQASARRPRRRGRDALQRSGRRRR